MVNNHKPLLAQFGKEVLDSHALIVAAIMSGETPSADTLLELGVEALTIDRLAAMVARQVDSIQSTHDVWQDVLECFVASLDLWSRLPDDDFVTGHRRLLQRLVRNAEERTALYHVTAEDRIQYNAQRDHGLPLAHAEA
jgi:hypothetical protein